MTTRSIAYDALRVIAVLMVITIHTCGTYALERTPYTSNYLTGILYEAVVQIGVPLFVMLSGAFVPGHHEASWSAFYRKRMPKLLIPLSIWLPMYYLLLWLKGDDVGQMLSVFWRGGSWMHLWYLVMLAGLYFLVPLLNALIDRLGSHPRRLYTVSSALLLMGLFTDTYHYLIAPDFRLFFPLMWIPYTGYFLMGYALRRYPGNRGCGWPIVLYILATAGTAVLGYYTVRTSWGEYCYRNLSPLIVISAVSLFSIFARQASAWQSSKLLRRMAAPAGEVMGIYLLHLAVLILVTKAVMVLTPSVMDMAWLSIPLRVSVSFILSYWAARLMRRWRLQILIGG